MAFVAFAVAALVAGLIHIAIQRPARTRQRIANVLLRYQFALPVGLGGLFAFVGHTVRAVPVAASIGWPTGNPFQYEVAVANLAFGVLGMLCLWSESFWNATGIGWSIFLLGAAAIHLHQIHIGQAFAPGNAGAMLYFDIVAPIIVVVLLGVRADR